MVESFPWEGEAPAEPRREWTTTIINERPCGCRSSAFEFWFNDTNRPPAARREPRPPSVVIISPVLSPERVLRNVNTTRALSQNSNVSVSLRETSLCRSRLPDTKFSLNRDITRSVMTTMSFGMESNGFSLSTLMRASQSTETDHFQRDLKAPLRIRATSFGIHRSRSLDNVVGLSFLETHLSSAHDGC